MVAMVRPKAAQARLGVSKSAFYDNFVQKPGGPEIVPGTRAVRRLRRMKINARVSGFFDDEIDALIEAMRAERDAELSVGKPRDRSGQFAAKEEEVEKRP
jgi:hypothetical protein